MILLLGASGYIGSAFRRALIARGHAYADPNHRTLDATNYGQLIEWLHDNLPEFVINAAGYVGSPNVDACETAKAETLWGNLLLPRTVALACASLGVPWGHVSSGCIYSGAHCQHLTITDLMTTDHLPEPSYVADAILGYKETDTPNFTFRHAPCSFYSGVKALAEEILVDEPQCYIWRTRIPFDEFDGPRNYLSKLQSFPKFFANGNSLSHRGDFVNACLDLWGCRAPYGTYNLTNPGWMRSTDIVDRIRKHLCPDRVFTHFANNAEYEATIKTSRSACVLDVSKALATGIKIRPVEDAVEDALTKWRKAV